MTRPKFGLFCREAGVYCNESLANMPSPEGVDSAALIQKWAELCTAHVAELRKKYDIADGMSPEGMGDEDETAWEKWNETSQLFDDIVAKSLLAADEWAESKKQEKIHGEALAVPHVVFVVGSVDRTDPVNRFVQRLAEALIKRGLSSASPTTMTCEAWQIRSAMHLPQCYVVVPVLCRATVECGIAQRDIETARELHKAIVSVVFDNESFREAMSEVHLPSIQPHQSAFEFDALFLYFSRI